MSAQSSKKSERSGRLERRRRKTSVKLRRNVSVKQLRRPRHRMAGKTLKLLTGRRLRPILPTDPLPSPRSDTSRRNTLRRHRAVCLSRAWRTTRAICIRTTLPRILRMGSRNRACIIKVSWTRILMRRVFGDDLADLGAANGGQPHSH